MFSKPCLAPLWGRMVLQTARLCGAAARAGSSGRATPVTTLPHLLQNRYALSKSINIRNRNQGCLSHLQALTCPLLIQCICVHVLIAQS